MSVVRRPSSVAMLLAALPAASAWAGECDPLVCAKPYRLIRLAEVLDPDRFGTPITPPGSGQNATYGYDNTFGINDLGQVVGTARRLTTEASGCGDISHLDTTTGVYERPYAFLWLPAPAFGLAASGSTVGCNDDVFDLHFVSGPLNCDCVLDCLDFGILLGMWSVPPDLAYVALASPVAAGGCCGEGGLPEGSAAAEGDGPSWDAESAVEELGFASIEAFRAWVMLASQEEIDAAVSTLKTSFDASIGGGQ